MGAGHDFGGLRSHGCLRTRAPQNGPVYRLHSCTAAHDGLIRSEQVKRQMNIALNSMGVFAAHPRWSVDKQYRMLRADVRTTQICTLC